MGRAVNREVVNDMAKLVMHRMIARAAGRDPLLIDRARSVLARLAGRFPGHLFVVEWEQLLKLPPDRIRRLLASRDQDMTRLRLTSPFMTEGVNFTDIALRLRIGRAARRLVARRDRRHDELQSAG